eukprot:14702470-Heterocapsa_arctica.AAC.1
MAAPDADPAPVVHPDEDNPDAHNASDDLRDTGRTPAAWSLLDAVGALLAVPADASDEQALNHVLALVSRLLGRPLVPGVGPGADV